MTDRGFRRKLSWVHSPLRFTLGDSCGSGSWSSFQFKVGLFVILSMFPSGCLEAPSPAVLCQSLYRWEEGGPFHSEPQFCICLQNTRLSKAFPLVSFTFPLKKHLPRASGNTQMTEKKTWVLFERREQEGMSSGLGAVETEQQFHGARGDTSRGTAQ